MHRAYETDSRRSIQIGGPMWGAPIHNREFVKEMLDHVEENSKDFKTSERIKGMLTVAYNVSCLVIASSSRPPLIRDGLDS
jgi:tRNA G26 N,N-dimethylase Trm1